MAREGSLMGPPRKHDVESSTTLAASPHIKVFERVEGFLREQKVLEVFHGPYGRGEKDDNTGRGL